MITTMFVAVMRTIFKQLAANFIFILHTAIVALLFFGWLIPKLWYVYVSLILITLISESFLGYCLLSKWEFDLRKSVNPALEYDYSFSSYYTYKLTRKHLSSRFISAVGTAFLVASLILAFIFRFGYSF